MPFISGVQHKSQFFHELSLSLSLPRGLSSPHGHAGMAGRQCQPVPKQSVDVYQPKPTTLDKQEQQTRDTFANIPTDFLMWSADTAGTNPVSSVGIATRLRTGRTRARIPAETRGFCRLAIVQIGSGAHPPSSSMVTGVLSRGQSGRGFHLVPSWSLPLLPLYALMAWTETTLLFYRVFQDAEVCAKCWACVEMWH